MTRFLWIDTFKDGKTVATAPPELLLEETQFAWNTMVDDSATRFFPVVPDDGDIPCGAVVHMSGLPDYDAAVKLGKTIPWAAHNFADWEMFPFGNFVSIQKLFHQNGKYRAAPPVQRPKPFTSNPTVTWYAAVSAKDPGTYDSEHGLEDAVACYRLIKGAIAEEVYDIHSPKQGKILRIKANDRAEVESYLNELSSVRAGAAKVTTVRTQAVCAWDFVWF